MLEPTSLYVSSRNLYFLKARDLISASSDPINTFSIPTTSPERPSIMPSNSSTVNHVTRLVCLLLLLASTLYYFFHSPPSHLRPWVSFSRTPSSDDSSLFNHSSHHPHLKRDQDLLNNFGSLVDKGIKYFEEGIVPAYEGSGDPPPDYGDDPFDDNGWTVREQQEENTIPDIWDPVLEDIPPGAPDADEYELIRVDQDESFANAWSEENDATEAVYSGFYIPISNTIIMTYTYSPRFRISRDNGEAADSEDDKMPEAEIEQHIPRLHTLSDVVWETWKTRSPDPATLRYYAIHEITNEITKPVMDYLFERNLQSDDDEEEKEEEEEEGWEARLTYGLDSDEGKALLGTPSGVGMAYLMINNHEVLGKRDLRVSIWREEGKRCMIWEMIPYGEKSTFDEYVSTLERKRA
ncbi:MAG: hypothetical protein Q9169_003993 [Polycauliona sp. 2 TL-2023]